ncbi:FHA domain-containing protein [Aureimonas sp. AU4]|uniref:FHA domain-containing protein n=1 Tax=Aureimonas sp. AU4 TaxID=1638163 RepID=UPI0007826E0E|nr:BON domain-containing protein [Aureimonas sp. AU4]
MTDAAGDPIILKILTGVQSGVDVFLVDGDYVLGSGDDDDIQIFDVSLLPGHVRLRVQNGKVSLAGGAGPARTQTGVQLAADGEPVDLEPLDVVWVGTTRFTTGLASANWSSLGEGETPTPVKVRRPGLRLRRGRADGVPRPAGERPALLRWGLPVAAGIAVAAVGAAAFATMGVGPGTAGAQPQARPTLERVETALRALPFARDVAARQEVDGAVFVTGFVETPAERRAVLQDVRTADEAARVRVGVLESMRAEIAQLLKSEAPGVDFQLSNRAEATLTGTILDPAEAQRVTGLVESSIIGLQKVSSQIRTRDTLLADIQTLSDRSGIAPLTLLRLDGSLAEISGVLPSEKVDSWVGFLQAYSSQYAKLIPLRSLVQLQNPDGSLRPAPGGPALVLGDAPLAAGDVRMDPDRLTAGDYKLEDVFANRAAAVPDAATLAQPASGRPLDLASVIEGGGGIAAGRAVRRVGTPFMEDAAEGAASQALAARTAPTATVAQETGATEPDAAPRLVAAEPTDPGQANNKAVRDLIGVWNSKGMPGVGDGPRIDRALEALRLARPQASLEERYAPIRRREGAEPQAACWRGAEITPANVSGILFWLDLLSVSSDLTLQSVAAETRPLVLEAALNPSRVDDCASRAGLSVDSVYLDEVTRNPDFVSFITRDLARYDLDIAGANLGSVNRFVQLRGGRKLHEGAAPDRNSRIASVGELGVAVARGNDVSAVIFGTNVNWIVR